MTKRELIYTVFEKIKINSDDMDISEEFVSFLIDSKRAMLLKQRFDAKPWAMPIETKQELCLSLEVASVINGEPCFGKILRTKNPLPASIKIKGKEGPLTVRRYDNRAIHVNIIPLERIPFIGHNYFTAQMIYGTVDYDNRFYLVSESNKLKLMTDIKIADIFENPDEANALRCAAADETSCEIWDRDYPVELSMVDDIVKLVVQDLSRTLSIPDDSTNDADGERKGQ
tara:strand:+ start:2988 stop:3671 length:684 start_codon:yes stop_codon:yes gene_type:complete